MTRARLLTSLLSLVLAAPLLPAALAGAGGTPKCFGRPATIVGTGETRINGTGGSDVIVGGPGAQVIDGKGGHDFICGNGGADRLIGGNGNDSLSGGAGWDDLRGGRGSDVLLGGPGTDSCFQGPGSGPSRSCSPMAAAACGMPMGHRRRIAAGVHADRSGEVQIVPVPTSFMGPGLSHAGPWTYLQSVPIFLYGPGHVKAQGKVGGRATLASIAPTIAELMGETFEGDERPLTGALEGSPTAPKLVVTLVWDAGGQQVLKRRWKLLPALKDLIPKGTWYKAGEVGSSPSNTPPAHATIGSGAYADRHGLVDLGIKKAGKVIGSWSQGPSNLQVDTLADVYDAANGNAPLIGMVGGVSEHLGMIGHGDSHPGGDKDFVVLPDKKSKQNLWGINKANAPFFDFPAYVNAVGGWGHQKRLLDQRDGKRDGKWRAEPFSHLLGGFNSPARIPHQTKVTKEIIEQEGFGEDATTDLLFLNHKIIDFVAHEWGPDSVYMKDTLRSQDRDLGRFVQFLDSQVGAGEWVMILTADHGATRDPRKTGHVPLDRAKVAAAIRARFGDVLQRARPTMLFLDLPTLKARGHTVEQVAAFTSRLTRRQVALDSVPIGKRTGGAFRAAFPSSWAGRLACMR